ncbi:hypothetical protein RAS1_35500 [Phycisphaerae bacterium RAS1]|nr:hypothetical protein RAS1_35500 [Phycisphaerae bacterium RAS1]
MFTKIGRNWLRSALAGIGSRAARTIGALALTTLGVQSAFAPTGGTHTFVPGTWSGRLTITGGKANTPYSFQYYRQGVWNTRYSGTADAAGGASVRLWDTAGGISNPNRGTPTRVVFNNGSTSNYTVAQNNADSNNPNVTTVAAGVPATLPGETVEIRQNGAALLNAQGPGWYTADSFLVFSLPGGFNWTQSPAVDAVGDGLELGSSTLSPDGSTISIHVMSNLQTDPNAGVRLTGGTIQYDGSGDVGDQSLSGWGSFEHDGSFEYVQGQLGLFTITPEPSTGLATLAMMLVALRRRR